ncbi:hypothetical protein ABIE89_007106 [Bradyrhizobium niftali]|uniref:hypothetical protein n=1 Tax=Bradyrhizobium niftali TaxID=2560055 RepID=UPI0038338565
MHSFQSARDRHGTKLNILLEYPLRHIAAGAHFWLTAVLEFSRLHNAAFGRHNATPLVLSVRSSETGWPVSRFNDSMAHELAVIEARKDDKVIFAPVPHNGQGKEASPCNGHAMRLFERQADGSLKLRLPLSIDRPARS